MKPRATIMALWAGLALTLVAVVLAPEAKQDAVLLAERPRVAAVARTDAASGAVAGARVLAIRPRGGDEALASAGFAPQQWTPPSPKPKAAAAMQAASPPPPPMAPPLPFRVLGRYVEQEQVAVFLQHNDQNLVVRVGDTIAGDYKVERLEGATLTLRYLPLDQAQTLDVGAAP
jgi:hypothetical protein